VTWKAPWWPGRSPPRSAVLNRQGDQRPCRPEDRPLLKSWRRSSADIAEFSEGTDSACMRLTSPLPLQENRRSRRYRSCGSPRSSTRPESPRDCRMLIATQPVARPASVLLISRCGGARTGMSFNRILDRHRRPQPRTASRSCPAPNVGPTALARPSGCQSPAACAVIGGWCLVLPGPAGSVAGVLIAKRFTALCHFESALPGIGARGLQRRTATSAFPPAFSCSPSSCFFGSAEPISFIPC
jgi:hypothetical protein